MTVNVLFLIFNRPDKTGQVFERIREAKPQKLFIAADGPREDKCGEKELCELARRVVLDHIDWPCEVFTLLREKNIGCKRAVSSAISWFFDHVEAGIILEDDCYPSLSFFPFCQELLERYWSHERVMMISGDYFQPGLYQDSSYYFSRYVHIWGWATWRRAWRHYDLEMKAWPEYRRQMRLYTFLPPSLAKMAERHMDTAYRGRISTWDAQWLFACWNNDGVSVIPSVNLISNIDSGGTHMKVYDPCIHHPVGNIAFPMTHPASVEINNAADQYIQRYVYFRGWRQAIVLIVRYLLRVLWREPRNLFSAIQTVIGNVFSEASRRVRE